MDGVILSKSEEKCAESLGLFNNKNKIVTLDGTVRLKAKCLKSIHNAESVK